MNMSGNKQIKYAEMESHVQSFKEVTSFLDTAKSKCSDIELNKAKAQGKTAEQALCGFKSKISDAITAMEQLKTDSVSFFIALGVQFENADADDTFDDEE